jgi:mannose-6-phosphate isomerase
MLAGEPERSGVVHTLEAVDDAEIVEVSTPQLEDVVRLEDRYGRVPGATPSKTVPID